MLYTALVRASDHGILVNVRSGVTQAFLLALDASGGLVGAENVDQQFLQQILFDPRDPAEDTVLGGTPFSNRVDAVDASAHAQASWVEVPGANFIGIAAAVDGTLLAGSSGQGIGRYDADGTLQEVFVDLASSIGIEEVNGMAVDSVGNVYLAQNSSGHVAVFDATGEFVQFLTAASFNDPVDVYYNPDDGLLYVGNKSDGVLTVLSTDGAVEAVVDLGGAHIGTAGRVP